MSRLEDLNRQLDEKNLIGFWTFVRDAGYEPSSPFKSCIWKWQDISNALETAGDVLDLSQSFRRFIGFRTPSLPLGTTHTMLLGAQLVKPGEIAEAHHHTMGAIRFVIRGGGAQTTVNGEPFPMEPGDLITTPSLSWHDHYNGSDRPIIWLDGADGPFIKYLGIGFAERFHEKQQTHQHPVGSSAFELGPARPAWVSTSSAQPPPYRYRWEDTEKALRALGEKPGDPCDGILLRFVNPLTGGPTLHTVSCEIQMLRPGEQTSSHRHTSSTIYHVFRGKGYTFIGDERHEWAEGDTFTVPYWQRHHHGNASRTEAILFTMNDRPIMEAFGFYREEMTQGS
ncbi:MAG TPA: cupin domain-containing protein [Candidatus Binatia bacterium]